MKRFYTRLRLSHRILFICVFLLSATTCIGQSFRFKDFQDTLVLSAYVADCGEFGGRDESLIIYRLQKDWFARFEKEKACRQTLILNEELKPLNTFATLDSAKLKLIEHYVNTLKNIAFDESVQSNAPTAFWIKINGDVFTYKTDPSGNWPQFQYVKEKLFKKGSLNKN